MPDFKKGKPMKDAANKGWAVKVTEITRTGARRETFTGGETPEAADAAADRLIQARRAGSAAGWKSKEEQ
jgi:hypothetical protein